MIFVIAGVVCWGELHTEKQKVAEEVWEPPVEIENSEAETEEAENAETSTESAYWFIPQASDDLLTEEEKEQLQSTVLSAAESVFLFLLKCHTHGLVLEGTLIYVP